MTHASGSLALALSPSLSHRWGGEPDAAPSRVAGWTPAALGESEANPALHLRRDMSRFRLPAGEWVEIRRRHVLRRLLGALVARHLQEPGLVVSSDDLFAAGWPGECIGQASRDNRLRVAIATLRAMGLAEIIDTARRGYRLRPALALSFEADRPMAL